MEEIAVVYSMTIIIFATHSTTFDNEAGIASGFHDVELSLKGKQQARELGEYYKNDYFEAIFCSDLRRSYETAEIAFGTKFPIIRDARLRECDYGDFTGCATKQIEAQKIQRVREPFPHGESYEQAAARMKSFLDDVRKNYDAKKVMIIGHRATQYSLEHLIHGVALEDIVNAPWAWQAGWMYHLQS